MRNHLAPSLQAIGAAILFGASAPISKSLLGSVDPIPLAAFLYFGSGLGSWLLLTIRNRHQRNRIVEERLTKPDLPWLTVAIFAGGVAAPILLLIGLERTPASTASLLLNFEAAATALIAALVFREAVGRRIAFAIGLITLASILLTWNGRAWGFSFGALAVIAACFLWGLDNNATRNISGKDPLMIVGVKGICAGLFSFFLAVVFNIPLPDLKTILIALLVGFICYGLSIQLFILALRGLGSARTGSLFGIAPFIGAILSLLFLNEIPQILFWVAFPVMGFGAWLMVTERHGHPHSHIEMEHAHSHDHQDGHHTHSHADEIADLPGSHSHLHTHEPGVHDHPHTPDLHHRHAHSDDHT